MDRRPGPSNVRERADEVRTATAGNGDVAGEPDSRAELLRVALAAYAAHLAERARVRMAGASTAWGRSARIANLRGHQPR